MMIKSEAGLIMAGTKTTMFNQTCDRLREYLKEKRALENSDLPSSSRTMNLFPIENQNNRSSPKIINSIVEEDYEPEPKDMMTIFYNGQVIVVQNVSSEKANEIMLAAEKLSFSGSKIPNSSVPCGKLPQAIARDLSQTRSHSLTRFFEKRKERINAKAPYTLKDKSWLGLSAAPGN